MQPSIPVPEPVLVGLLAHAASAARLVGHIDTIAVGPLADHIDAIVHEISELLGSPRGTAVSASPFMLDLVTQDATQHAVPDLAAPVGDIR
jgi:hypothetical protein